MAGLTLYDFELDEDCYRARLALSLMGVAYRKQAVDMIPGGEHLTPAILALNPAGRLPILTHGDRTLPSVPAILIHLAQAFDPSGRWLPRDPHSRGETELWLDFATTRLSAARDARLSALFGLDVAAEGALRQARRALCVVEDHLTHHRFAGFDWVVGDGPTVADIALYPSFALSRDYGLDHDAFPALRAWARRIRHLPGFITMPGIPDYA